MRCSTLGSGDALESLPRRSTHPQTTSALEETPDWLLAARLAESKKAIDVRILDLREVTSFTDYFIVCSVSNPRQGHAICDEIGKGLKAVGELPSSVEGYDPAEWILMDYGDFLVHIFSENARSYYELERLWRHAKLISPESPA